MKKLLSVLLVAAMVLGLAGTAFAGTPSTVAGPKFSDIAGNDAEADITLLAVKGILKGDAGTTTVRPDSTITRAEFAAMVVRMLGKESLATSLASMKPATKDEIPSWAWGYVNVVSSMGIMKGDPDGSFRPLDNVTFAEALAMLERAIGWDIKAVGLWPTNYLMVAYELDLVDGVDVFANTPATRGEVAIMMVNTMNTDRLLGVRDDGTDNKDDSILEASTVTGVVTAVDAANNKITIGSVMDLGASVSLVGAKTFNDLLNVNVKAIKVSDKIVYIEVTDDANVITGTFEKFDTNDDGENVIVVDGDEYVLDYSVAGDPPVTTIDATFRLNGTKLTNFTVASTKIVKDDAVVLNIADGVVVNVDASRVTYTNALVTDVSEDPSADKDDYLLDIEDDATWDHDSNPVTPEVPVAYLNLELTTSTPVTIDGVAKTVKDLDDNDVVYVTTAFDASGDATVTVKSVEAFRATVKGEVTKTRTASSGRYVTIKLADGTSKEYKLSFITGLPTVGDTVEYRLNKAGQLRHNVTWSATAKIAYITDLYSAVTSDGTTYYAVVDEGGVEKTFTVGSADPATLYGTLSVDDFIAYKTDIAGKLSEATIRGPWDVTDGVVVAIDATNGIVIVDDGSNYVTFGVDGLAVYEDNGDGTYTHIGIAGLAKGDVVSYVAGEADLLILND